jgi:transposase
MIVMTKAPTYRRPIVALDTQPLKASNPWCKEHVICPVQVAHDLSGACRPFEIGMRRTQVLEGLRVLKLRDVLSRWEAEELSQIEAAELLGLHERTFRRWARRFESDGDEGLLDRRLGRHSSRAVPRAEAEEVERPYRERYQGFTAKHFHEHLATSHAFAWSYSWTKGFLQSRGLLAKAPRRGAHRRKRPRRPMVGMMLHQDASKHVWIEGLGASTWS